MKILYIGIKILLLITGFIIAFFSGFYISSNEQITSYTEVNVLNKFSRYVVTRDIAMSLNNKDYARASCQANLDASHFYDFVKECMTNSHCAEYIAVEVKQNAPEILDETLVKFNYMKREGDFRKCS